MKPRVEEVMAFLRPNGWAVWDNDLTTAQYFDGVEPITLEEYEQGEKDYIVWKAEQEAAATAKRQALLDKLGITEEEARLLLGGN
jgi:hypothetical protein